MLLLVTPNRGAALIDALRTIISDIWVLMLSLRQTVRVWDVIDILIIAFIIYRILAFLSRTNASSVIKGVIFLLIIAWLSNFLNMKVVNFLLNQIMLMGVVVLVVLFQPEIRKLFELLGSSRIYLLFRKRAGIEDAETVLQSVVSAADAMKKSKTGAIIVFEREVGLNDFAATGIRIDADVSSELIQNIFYHNSPLHDGALLIREGRLLAASCMLPLSNNINLGRDIGMRHRAGVGISERSDSLVIIVSEQTGSISVAIDGMLKRQLSIEIFEKLLRNELIPGESKKRAKKMKVKKP